MFMQIHIVTNTDKTNKQALNEKTHLFPKFNNIYF